MGPGKKIADIGCGSGFFALPAARMAGRRTAPSTASTPTRNALRELREKAEKEGLTNVFLLAGDAEGIVPCENCADIVFFGICLHDFRDPGQVLTNARRILRKGGLLADLDWKKKPTSRGPPLDIRFDEAKACRVDPGGRLRDRIGGGLGARPLPDPRPAVIVGALAFIPRGLDS